MKTKIIKTIAALMLSLLSLPMMGQDFMEVYFKDGIYKKFYLEGLKEWKVSQYDADGVKHADYNYQHIKTNTHDFVFELEKIDSIVFTKFDEEKAKQDFCETMSVVISVLSKYENKEDIESKLDQIIKTEGVEDAWCDEYYLYVKFRNWETISFQLAYIDFEDNNIDSTYVNQMKSYIPQFRSILSQDGRKPSFAFINQQQLDTSRKDQIELGESLVEEFIKCGFNPDSKYIDNPTIEFFDGPIYEYDLIHLVTHGNYLNGQHHFVTAEVLGEFFSLQDEISDENWEKIGKSFIDMMDMTEKYKYKGLSYIGYTYTQEWRGIKLCLVGHPCILEDFFGEYGISSGTFRPNAILFDGACDNMNGDDEEKYSLADKLIKNHGLRLFLGYKGTNTKSPWASNEFYRALLCGKSTKVAFNELDPKYRYEFSHGAVLMDRYNNDYDDEYFFITSTITSETDPETVKTDYYNSKVVSVKGYTTSLDPQKIKCGFLYSTNKDLSSAKNVIDNAPVKGSQPFADGRGNVVFRYDIKDLQSGNTYYYCAYTFDGEYYNCGDTLSFYVPVVSSSESYAVYNAGTLTFYHDQLKNSREGTVYKLNTGTMWPSWLDYRNDISKVVFDKSFANARPTSTFFWFREMKNLTSIEGIQYLNTSEVTNMLSMFLYCEKLTSLDVSKFNTEKVTDMCNMFCFCSSLTSLDVSNFDTRNVTNMAWMFCWCENLTSLDVSNFDTRNVTNMSGMFEKCSSLASLDVSKFDTRNVTDMSEMFSCCSSLTTLDVSNFDTRNVTNMYSMFYYCWRLTTLDVSSFDTRNVTNMAWMFCCLNLTSLDVSNFDTRNVTNMSVMFSKSDFTSLDVSNFNMSSCVYSKEMFEGCVDLKYFIVSSTMETLDESACRDVGICENGTIGGCFTPCTIIAPDGFNFGVDTSGESFTWKSGTFKFESGNTSILSFTVNGVSFKMVAVEGGTFMMGASDYDYEALSIEKPQHQVTLSSYYIGEVEVTQELWNAVMGTNPSHFKSSNKLPVECVSWDDCQRFIAKLNNLTGETFSLPTEAQWEFAARGGNNGNDYIYSGSNSVDFVAWYDDNSGGKTHNVANKVPNELGLYDLSGNVAEWCQDYLGDYSSNSQTNPSGPSSGSTHIYRGGNWNSVPASCLVYKRKCAKPGDKYNSIGLRLVL